MFRKIKKIILKEKAKDLTIEAAKRHRSFDNMSAILIWLLSQVKGKYHDFNLINADVLELGSGKFLSHTFGFYICGCKSITSIDKYRQLSYDAVREAMTNRILARRYYSIFISHDEYIKRLNSILDTGYNLNKLAKIGIKYIAPYDIVDSGLSFKYNFVYSYTVLEHIPKSEVVELLKCTMGLLQENGYFLHFIDLEDHLDPINDPFGFFQYNIWSDEQSFTRGNRLRFSEWENIFNSIPNIEWDIAYVARRGDIDLPKFISPTIYYIDDEDLRKSAITIIGRKK